jgi:hypothetical protein
MTEELNTQPLATRWLAYQGVDAEKLAEDTEAGFPVAEPFGYLLDNAKEAEATWEKFITSPVTNLDDGWFLTRLEATTKQAAEWLTNLDRETAVTIGFNDFTDLPDGVTTEEVRSYSSKRGEFKPSVVPEALGVDYDDKETDENGYVYL